MTGEQLFSGDKSFNWREMGDLEARRLGEMEGKGTRSCDSRSSHVLYFVNNSI